MFYQNKLLIGYYSFMTRCVLDTFFIGNSLSKNVASLDFIVPTSMSGTPEL
jgi:hypothetical protein